MRPKVDLIVAAPRGRRYLPHTNSRALTVWGAAVRLVALNVIGVWHYGGVLGWSTSVQY